MLLVSDTCADEGPHNLYLLQRWFPLTFAVTCEESSQSSHPALTSIGLSAEHQIQFKMCTVHNSVPGNCAASLELMQDVAASVRKKGPDWNQELAMAPALLDHVTCDLSCAEGVCPDS